MSILRPAAVIFTAGIATHLLFYKKHEFHNNPWRNVQVFLLTIMTIIATRVQYCENPLRLAATSALSQAGVFLAGLYTSLLIYRIFFNPLNKLPGPFWARISKFNTSFRNRKLDGHRQLLRLHQKYGPFVRIGPNDLSVVDPEGVQVTSGPGTKCIKGPWYDASNPLTSMHTTRDKAAHDRRRRIWAPAFSDKALRGYQSRIQRFNDILNRQFEKMSGQPVNASKWFNLYSFDVMGDLGFGEPFNMLENGEEHWAIALLNAAMDPVGFWFPIWFFRMLLTIPGATRDYHRFVKYCTGQVQKRIKMGKDARPDIAGYLVDAFEKSDKSKEAMVHLAGDSRLIIVAGSDTTAATLTYLCYYLAGRPDIVETIRKEIEPMMEADGSVNHIKVQGAQYLNACINETLRLQPPVPCGVFRQMPKEGVYIGEVFIAGNTVIQMPGYVMGRDEKIYSQPLEFIPERWSSRPELILHKDAWQPFSSGPFGCIGKGLALVELRTVLSMIVTNFTVAFAPGEDGTKLLTQTTEHFTLGIAPLNLVFTKRK